MKQSISMYHASIPVFKQLLSALDAILDKAEAHVTSHAIDAQILLQACLYPDMYNLTLNSTDFVKGITARLAGIEIPVFEDNETSFAALKSRIEKTLLFISNIKPEQINVSEEKEIITRPGTSKEKKFNGQSYLLHYGIPQFFLHVSRAYRILRRQGVQIGMRDYMGTF